jgi:hypothetical protein
LLVIEFQSLVIVTLQDEEFGSIKKPGTESIVFFGGNKFTCFIECLFSMVKTIETEVCTGTSDFIVCQERGEVWEVS